MDILEINSLGQIGKSLKLLMRYSFYMKMLIFHIVMTFNHVSYFRDLLYIFLCPLAIHPSHATGIFLYPGKHFVVFSGGIERDL